jgi:opacity protein-like surface antigen
MRRVLVLAAIAAGALAADAAAQTTQRPSRPSRGLFGGGTPVTDPNRDRQELTLTASVLGGYEDFIVPGTQEGETFTPATGGTAYSGTTNASLRYWRGRAARSFSANVHGESRFYSLANIDPTLGGGVDLAANTQAGRKNMFGVTQMFSYEPSLAFGAYGPLTQTVAPSELPGADGTGFLDQQSWSSSSAVNAQRRWTTRQTTTGTFMYLSRRFLNDLGYDSDTRAADARYSWNMRRTLDLDLTYRYSHAEVEDPNGSGLPVKDQTVDAGLSYSRRLSPTRTYVTTQDPITRAAIDYWTPAGHGMVRVDLGRSWAVGVDYRRAVSVLPGLTLQSFATDAASVRANGRFGRRFEAMLSGAFSNGHAGYGDNPARYESYSGNAQLHIALSRCCAATINYDYYYYNLDQVATVPTGIPNQYDRNTVRVGLSLWVPLFGTFAGERGTGR